jgi:hypothetical protein
MGVAMSVYVAHFSFSLEPTTDLPLTGGHLSAVVDAPDLTQASEKFLVLLNKVKAQASSLREIYLDSVTEMNLVPPAGLITFLQFNNISGGSLDAANVGADAGDGVMAYGGRSAPGSDIMEPFVTFAD